MKKGRSAATVKGALARTLGKFMGRKLPDTKTNVRAKDEKQAEVRKKMRETGAKRHVCLWQPRNRSETSRVPTAP